MVSVLDLRSNGPGLGTALCFLVKTLNSQSVSFHPGVQLLGTEDLMLELTLR